MSVSHIFFNGTYLSKDMKVPHYILEKLFILEKVSFYLKVVTSQKNAYASAFCHIFFSPEYDGYD